MQNITDGLSYWYYWAFCVIHNLEIKRIYNTYRNLYTEKQNTLCWEHHITTEKCWILYFCIQWPYQELTTCPGKIFAPCKSEISSFCFFFFGGGGEGGWLELLSLPSSIKWSLTHWWISLSNFSIKASLMTNHYMLKDKTHVTLFELAYTWVQYKDELRMQRSPAKGYMYTQRFTIA